VHALDESLVVGNVGRFADIVGGIRIIRAEVDDDDISSLLLAKVPRLGLVCRNSEHMI
jgi:hypothetical protein